MGEHEINADRGMQNRNRAVFLDRDGVVSRSLVRNGLPFAPATLEDFEILPETPEACSRLKQAGYLLVVVTNQPEVGRHTMKKEVLDEMHVRMRRELPLDRIEACFHPGHGLSDCNCRKPKPGLLLKAAQELNIDLAQSWMVGDRWRDIDCGVAAGCRTIFIDRHYAEPLKHAPEFRAKNLSEAADLILADAKY